LNRAWTLLFYVIFMLFERFLKRNFELKLTLNFALAAKNINEGLAQKQLTILEVDSSCLAHHV